MSTSLRTQAGQGISFSVPARQDITGATLSVEYSTNSRFSHIVLTKTPTATGRQVTLTLSAAEVDSVKDTYFRVNSTINGVTTVVHDGSIDYIPKDLGGVVTAGTIDQNLPARLSDAALKATFARHSWLDVQDYGVVGNGTTDDTAALNAALAASASTGLELRCRPDHTYLVSRAGTKNFKNPTGSVITKGYCIQVPNGARVDFRGATLLHTAGGIDNVVLSNSGTTTPGDVITVRNVTVDGGGRTDTIRTVPMTWFYGCDSSTFDTIQLRNCSYVAGQLAAITNSTFDKLSVHAVTAQGWILGGNTADQIFDCKFGTLEAWDVASGGTFNQPGNGFCIGGQRLKIQRIIGRNCAGGHKYMPGNLDVHTDYAEFDGQALYGEASNGSANSGTKVQGDAPTSTGTAIANGTTGLTSVTGTAWAVGNAIFGPQIPSGTTITAVGTGTLTLSNPVPTGTGLVITGYATGGPPERISFSKIVSRNCTGIGLFIYYCGDVRIGDYYGYKNARAGTSFDVDTVAFTTLEIASLRIDWAGFTAINIGSGSTRYQFDQCAIYNPGDVTTSNVNGIVPGGAEGHIGLLTIMDDRKTPINFQGIAQVSTDPLFVREYRCFSTTVPIRLQNSRSFVGNPVIGSGTDALVGTVTLTAAATTTTISNSNIRSITFNSGWVEPVVELVPMNASAQTLGLPRYSVPGTGSLKLWHASAVGTEVFSYRIVGYTWRTPQLA